MDRAELYANIEKDATEIADKYSALRLKINTLDFDYDFKRNANGELVLIGVKAVIRVLGKTSKVPIGENQEYETYAQAYEATKKRWSDYYKQVRENRTPEEKKAEAKRQKIYREKHKQEQKELKRQQ